jgi:spermidine synthase
VTPPTREVARVETERGEIVLRERSAEVPPALELRVNGVFVMDTRETSTERALALHALELVERPARVLVAGLGLGFTMHEVLTDSRVEQVTVVEIEPDLVGWMRDGTIPHGPQFLADERLTVTVADVATALDETAEASYDLVLLDVDNGPGHLVYDANAAVYREPFLARCREVIARDGALVVWSADEAPELDRALRSVFGDATALAFDVALQGRDEQYWLHVARLPTDSP